MSKNEFSLVSPYDGSQLVSLKYLEARELESVLEGAHVKFKSWSCLSVSERCERILKFKKELFLKKDVLSKKMTQEMGKPLVEAQAEIDKCLKLIDYCVSQAPKALAEETRDGYLKVLTPQGVIYGIMPWNFPVWQTLRFAIPTLLAGNTVVVKPADNTSQTGAMLGEVFASIEELQGVYHNISIDHTTSDLVIEDSRVRGVSFTGSTKAGRTIAETSGKFLKKCVLELGGNDAYIIFSDSDVARAAQKSFDSRILNAGQSCISAKRFLVEESVEMKFLTELQKHLEKAIVGDPQSLETRIGPVSKKEFKDKLEAQVNECVRQGAKLFYRKTLPKTLPQQGAFFAPAILCNVSAGSPAFLDEIFGPVFLITTFKTEEEAIELANHSAFGLGGAVFSEDKEKTLRVARAMDTGSVALNDYFRSSPERPFGGVKDSGYGRELGPEGFLEFVNLKVLVL